jgi:hypothetical protein
MGIKIKYTDPTLNEFSTDDVIINVQSGSLFFKSNTKLFKLQGDDQSTTDISDSLKITGLISSIGSQYTVELDGNKGSGPRINIGNINDSDSFMTLGAFSSINNLDTKNRDFHLYGTNTTTGFYFDESAGKFGIGTKTPDQLLEVDGIARFNRGISVRPLNDDDAATAYLNTAGESSINSSNTGCVVIDNIQDENTMYHITIKGYNYSDGTGAFTITLGGYWYPDHHGGPFWKNTNATIEGTGCPFEKIQFGYLTSDVTKPAIILGETTTSFIYGQIWVDVRQGYSHEEIPANWDVTLAVTDISGYTISKTRGFPLTIGGSGVGNGTNDDGTVTIKGALAKGSGTFKIDHPDPTKTNTHYLQHSFVESPTGGDNIYRWTITTTNKTHTIKLPDYYKFLNKDDMIWVSALNHFGRAYGTVNDEQTEINITADTEGTYNILLVGTRKDPTILRHFKGVEILK